jgi:hypothetical protein
MSNSNGPIKSGQKKVTFGKISVQDSVVEFNRNRVENCSAVSLTDISLGSSSVFGGALAIVHSAQVFNLVLGVLLPSITEPDVAGFNLSVLILNCSFLQCSVFSNASSVQPGEANGEGGAVYAKSAALINFSITNSSFNDSLVSVRRACPLSAEVALCLLKLGIPTPHFLRSHLAVFSTAPRGERVSPTWACLERRSVYVVQRT